MTAALCLSLCARPDDDYVRCFPLQLSKVPVVLEDADLHVVTKVVATSGRECRIVEQLVGLRPWPATASGQRLRGSGHLWQTLRLVPLVHDGVVRVDGRPDVSVVVMRRLQPLKGLWRLTKDMRMLLRVVSQLVEVRCRGVCVL